MKTILLTFLLTTLFINLHARENPFEETQEYVDKKKEYIDNEKQKIKAKEAIVEKNKISKEPIVEVMIDEKHDDEIVVSKIKIKKEPLIDKIVTKQPLSFVNIYTVQNNLMIEVDKKYKYISKDILIKKKKILFDFQGNEKFYTVRKDIENKNYISYAIGTHPKNNYFRVVIDLALDTKYYKTTIDDKNGIIIVQRLRK